MAVKIVRQPDKIALLGAPTSAAAMALGHEGAPAALRAAGLAARLADIGYHVTDLGDDPAQLFQPDEESPRARNLPRVLQSLEALKPRVEAAVKSGALPLVLAGDCSIALATAAGLRRYYRHVGMIYFDRDADLNTPATSPSGSVDGMVVSHLTGRGAAEMVRFWGEPPLVREPDLALFGVARLDPPEEEVLQRSPLRRYLAADIQRRGAAAAAREAAERIQGSGTHFILHFDVDVISDFAATDYPGTGGLSLDEVREALEVFAHHKQLAAIEVTAYNPAKDADGAGAKIILDLLSDILSVRLETLLAAAAVSTAPAAAAGAATSAGAPATPAGPSSAGPAAAEQAAEAERHEAQDEKIDELLGAIPAAAPGEAWSSDSLEGADASQDGDDAHPGDAHSDDAHADVAPGSSDSGESQR